MTSTNTVRFTKGQIANNPAIEIDKVNEAERARKELENLGVWEKGGRRVKNPLEIKPDPKVRGQKVAKLISQSQ